MGFSDIQDYARYAREQCQFILMAHTDLRAASDGLEHAWLLNKEWHSGNWGAVEEARRLEDESNQRLWYSAQALMSAAANVSKALWGSKSTGALREPVRQALGIAEDSALWRAARQMRNNFDHYDERIAEAKSSGEHLRIEGIGSPLIVTGHTSRVTFRNYDPQHDALSFWGVTLSLTEVVTEARRIIHLADQVLGVCATCMDEGRAEPIRFD